MQDETDLYWEIPTEMLGYCSSSSSYYWCTKGNLRLYYHDSFVSQGCHAEALIGFVLGDVYDYSNALTLSIEGFNTD